MDSFSNLMKALDILQVEKNEIKQKIAVTKQDFLHSHVSLPSRFLLLSKNRCHLVRGKKEKNAFSRIRHQSFPQRGSEQ